MSVVVIVRNWLDLPIFLEPTQVPLGDHEIVVVLLQTCIAHNIVSVAPRYILQHLLLDILFVNLQRLLTVSVDYMPLEVVVFEVFFELVLGRFVGAQRLYFFALLAEVVQHLLGHLRVPRLRLVLVVDVAREFFVVALRRRLPKPELRQTLLVLLLQYQNLILDVSLPPGQLLVSAHAVVTAPPEARLVPLLPVLVPLLVDLFLVRVGCGQSGHVAFNLQLLALRALTQFCVDAE